VIPPPDILKFQRRRYVWLLLALVLFLVLSPLVDLTPRAVVVLEILFTITIFSVVNAASGRRDHFSIALALAAPWLLFGWWAVVSGEVLIHIIADILFVCLMYFAIYLILRQLLSAQLTDSNILCGAVAVYLLIGITWAQKYRVMEAFAPGSFSIRGGPSVGAEWSDFLYFSLTTLTTLGYGDVTPLTSLAGIWSTLEAVCGSLYIAVLVARLVALIRG
jgi:hypothetical protein